VLRSGNINIDLMWKNRPSLQDCRAEITFANGGCARPNHRISTLYQCNLHLFRITVTNRVSHKLTTSVHVWI
jgi:hypothetical protein